jgi:hypothetical protein
MRLAENDTDQMASAGENYTTFDGRKKQSQRSHEN